jgi:hypothetical protein
MSTLTAGLRAKLPYAGNSMKEFLVQALAATKITDAYSFARLTIPGLEPQDWRRYALNIINHSGKKSGILIIRRKARPHICGLVSYHCETELQSGRVLQLRHLAAIDILDPNPILSALLNHLAGIALRLHCKLMRIRLPDTERDRTSLYNALLQLRPRLALEGRFDVDWDLGEAITSSNLI